MSVSSFAQGSGGVEITIDAENGSKVFRGDVKFNDLLTEKTFDWFKRGSDAYKPDSAAVAFLIKKLPSYKLVVAMGTWCSDSHTLIPALYKVLQMANYPVANYYMFGVNRKKESLYAESKLYHIINVPTIIVYKGNIEIGRVTESVQKSIEADLQAIIVKDTAPGK